MERKCRFTVIVFLVMIVFVFRISAQGTAFVVVIDAGHGGHDPGAMGSVAKEKDINLAVALKVGELIEKEHNKNVKIHYTRKTDKYLTLQERADFANDKKADFFISIHTNSAKSKAAYGVETFTLGLAKTQANLAVAMRENSVILLEEDYKTKYKGFDPSSVDSYIMFEFMQDKYIDQSLELATFIQDQFKNYCKRYDRGVRQAGFWVLHRTAAPSVLIELGFISNKEEEKYLNSKEGQQKLAVAISKAFSTYKHNHDKKSGKASSLVAVAKNDEVESDSQAQVLADEANVINEDVKNNAQIPVYKVQLFAKKTKLSLNAADFKGIKNISYYEENNLYKYTAGNESEYRKIVSLKEEISAKFPDAFIVAFLNDKKISVADALKVAK